MKREIKFRVWDNLAHCYWGEGEGMDFKKIAFNFYDTLFEESRLVFEEYTGLKDKNGKEIYEGDILECSITQFGTEEIVIIGYGKGPVIFHEGAFKWNDEFLNINYAKEFTIIGNIFES